MNRVAKGIAGGFGLAVSAFMAYETVQSYNHVEDIRPKTANQVVHLGGFTLKHETTAKSGPGQFIQFFADLPRGYSNVLGLNNDKQPTLSPVDAYLGNAAAEFTIFLVGGAIGGTAVGSLIKK